MAPAMEMSEKSIEEYTQKMRARYARMKGKSARSKLLDEFVEMTGWDRKHANKVLLGIKRRSNGRRGKRGAPRRYGQELLKPLKTCWLAMEQPCGKRMKDMLPLWINHLDCRPEVRSQLCQVSAASIDRMLHGLKLRVGKKSDHQSPPRQSRRSFQFEGRVGRPMNPAGQRWTPWRIAEEIWAGISSGA